jgi:hypothetical protein
MNKKELLDKHFEMAKQFSREISPRLDKLVEDNRITTGAAYTVYDVTQCYGYTKIKEILDKAFKSKDTIRYMKRIKLSSWQYYVNDMQRVYDKVIVFCDEQEALPFEQTQKQVLIAKGELREY